MTLARSLLVFYCLTLTLAYKRFTKTRRHDTQTILLALHDFKVLDLMPRPTSAVTGSDLVIASAD